MQLRYSVSELKISSQEEGAQVAGQECRREILVLVNNATGDVSLELERHQGVFINELGRNYTLQQRSSVYHRISE